MAFASTADRVALLQSGSPCDLTVQIVTSKGVEIELAADDSDHALNIQGDWLKRDAKQCEIFRVNADGTLKPTIGAVYGDAVYGKGA